MQSECFVYRNTLEAANVNRNFSWIWVYWSQPAWNQTNLRIFISFKVQCYKAKLWTVALFAWTVLSPKFQNSDMGNFWLYHCLPDILVVFPVAVMINQIFTIFAGKTVSSACPAFWKITALITRYLKRVYYVFSLLHCFSWIFKKESHWVIINKICTFESFLLVSVVVISIPKDSFHVYGGT